MVTAATPPPLVITFDKASKFYEPMETVSGTISVTAAKSYTDHGDVSLVAESYMDTVSAIRGNIGKGPMKEADRTVFMKKTVQVSAAGKCIATDPFKFSFTLDKTGTMPLIDAYVGVEFSIVYKVTVKLIFNGRATEGKAEFYCNVPGSGIDSTYGKRYIPQDFNITPDGIKAAVKPGTKIP
jgi:hypothetical protein